jgi:hypothetical protein
MIKYHTASGNFKIAELEPQSDLITGAGDMLDILAEAGYHDCDRLIVHEKSLHRDFFDLKTGLAGKILQKFSNYRVRLAIIGDFAEIKSKSLRDFIRESNRGRTVNFVNSVEEAVGRLVIQ